MEFVVQQIRKRTHGGGPTPQIHDVPSLLHSSRAGASAEQIPLTHISGRELLEPGEQGLLAGEAISLTEGNQQLLERLVNDFSLLI